MANITCYLGSPFLEESRTISVFRSYWAVVGAPGRVEAIALTLCRKFLIEDFSICSNNDHDIEDKARPRPGEAWGVDAPCLGLRISDLLQGTLLESMIPPSNWQRLEHPS